MHQMKTYTCCACGSMAENTRIKPYQFEPTVAAHYSDEESDSDESDTDEREQASFTERF